MGWGFVVPTGKLLQSLAASNLLPSMFMLRGAPSPRRGVFVGCLIGYVICLIGFFQPSFSTALQNIAISCGMLCYFNTFFIFYKLRTTFSSLPRKYHSPFGMTGAVFASTVFALVLISAMFFQESDDTDTTLVAMIAIIVMLSLYYFCFAKAKQVTLLSPTLTASSPHYTYAFTPCRRFSFSSTRVSDLRQRRAAYHLPSARDHL